MNGRMLRKNRTNDLRGNFAAPNRPTAEAVAESVTSHPAPPLTFHFSTLTLSSPTRGIRNICFDPDASLSY